MNGDRTSDYVKAIEELCRKDDGVQIVVCVLKFKRADHYQSIKVKTLCEFGILSQVCSIFFTFYFFNALFLLRLSLIEI